MERKQRCMNKERIAQEQEGREEGGRQRDGERTHTGEFKKKLKGEVRKREDGDMKFNHY